MWPVLQQDKSACGNVPRLSVARLVLCTAVEPDSKHALGHLMPTGFANVRPYAGELDTRRRIMSRKLERRDTSSKWDPPSAVARHFIAKAEASKMLGIRAISCAPIGV
jgi:hypothetical protein